MERFGVNRVSKIILFLLGGLLLCANSWGGTLMRVTAGHIHSISADSRFFGRLGNYGPGDYTAHSDAYVYDRETGITELVSISDTGIQAESDVNSISISGDGRYAAFNTWGSLDPGDTNGKSDIYVYDRENNHIQRVSVSSSGELGNDNSYNPHLSADGRFVIFDSIATNLAVGGSYWKTLIHDRKTGETTLATTASSSTNSINTDGRMAAFRVNGANGAKHQIFFSDRETGVATIASVSTSGSPANNHAYDPHLSGNGRFVVFESQATNLLDMDTNGQTYDVFVRDLEKGTTEIISLASDGTQGNNWSRFASISPDGRYVAFVSLAALVPEDNNSEMDVYVRDRETGTTKLISADADGIARGGDNPRFTADGRVISFSTAYGYDPTDTNGAYDIYLNYTCP